MGLPSIDIIFKQLATSAIARSTRGKVALIIKDDTNKTFTTKVYTSASDVALDSALYTATNLQYILDAFVGTPLSVTVVRIDATGGLIATALAIVGSLIVDWIGIAAGVQADQDALVTWIKTQEALNKTYKAVVYNATTAPNCKHVVNFTTSSVTFSDTTRGTLGVATGEKYISTLVGIFAGIALNKSTTYSVCPNLTSVIESVNSNADINLGKFVLINETNSRVRIGAGINSLTTFDATNTSDMAQVVIVESMDMMLNDIRSTYKDSYCGNYKNKYDNQIMFISAVNSYFSTLEGLDILDPLYNNVVDVDVATQRAAWLDVGKTEASTWTDAQVKNMSYKNTVYLLANVKILGALENLALKISMA